MIKISALAIFISIILLPANAQNTYIKQGSVWKIDRMINISSKRDNRNPSDETYKLFVSGDTVINSIKYFKLFKTGIMYLEPPLEYKDKYIGAVRESGGRVYFIENKTLTEQLLYDYNLKVNDTIKGIIANNDVILDIDTLENGRRRFHITKHADHHAEAYIIEGIGTTGGLLNEPVTGHFMMDDSYLVCYSENYNIIYRGFDRLNCGCDELTSRFPLNKTGIWSIVIMNADEAYKEDEKYKYYFTGDTVIQNNTKEEPLITVYYKLYKSGVAYYDEPFYYNNIYVGAIRSYNNKFLFLKKDESSEKMVVDYNLNIKDIVAGEIGKYRIIDSIAYFPDGRKKIMSTGGCMAGCCPKPVFIEGIGHVSGLLEDASCTHVASQKLVLSCYYEGNIKIYEDPEYSSRICESFLSIPEKPLLTEGLNVYPVPSKDFINIEIKNENQLYTKIEIYNISGKMVYTNIYRNDLIKIDVSKFGTGIYIFKALRNKSLLSGKFIVE